MLALALLIPVLAQAAAPPLSPPGAATTAAPVYGQSYGPVGGYAVPPAGGSNEWGAVGAAVTVLFGGGGAVVTLISARAVLRSKQIDVNAAAAAQAQAKLDQYRDEDRKRFDDLWAKCQRQDDALKRLEVQVDALQREGTDCRQRLAAKTAECVQCTERYGRLATKYQQLADTHARCPRPDPATPTSSPAAPPRK
ncbi:MAG: hypothetical protein JWO31_1585 [Phycisphaerales bacterium]|nr:hypothetical protein [Phycisphaerales bacterium]